MWVSVNFGNVTVEAWSGAPGNSTLIARLRADHRLEPVRARRRPAVRARPRRHRLRARVHRPARTSRSTTSPSARSRSRTPRSSAARPPVVARRPTRASCSSATRPTPASTARSTAPSRCRAGRRTGCPGCAAGPHTLTVGMRDRFGTPDSDPGRLGVDGRSEPARGSRAPAPPVADADGDGVPDASDNCPAAANASQADADGDGVGDACETAPSGQPRAGRRRAGRGVKVLSGEVFIKLPRHARSFKQAPLSGFVPLKGQAALPIGTVVDTRKGRMAMASTVDGRGSAPAASTQSAIALRGHLPDPPAQGGAGLAGEDLDRHGPAERAGRGGVVRDAPSSAGRSRAAGATPCAA